MKKSISRWYLIQNIIALIIIIGFHLNLLQTILFGLVLLLSIIFSFDFGSPTQLKKANWFVQFFLQPWALITAWNTIYLVLVQHHLNNWGLLTILFLYYLVMFIPFVFIIAAKAKNLILRLIFTYSQFFIIVLALNRFNNNILLSSTILQAVSYFIFIVLLMRLWGAAGPNLKANKNESVWIIVSLIIFTLAFIILNAWNNISSIHQLINDIYRDKITNFLQSLETGIAEEVTFRYGLSICFLWIFEKSSHRLIFTIFGSSIFFGLSHLANLTTGQGLMPTLSQVIFAFSSGLLFMMWFLYTGKLWITIFLHFFLDWVSTFGHDSMTVNSILNSIIKTTPEFIGAFAILIVFGGLLIWMMHGKRRQVMEEHAQALIGYHKS
ncbi:CPBP family intramembrane glutamic endopeptidase [Lactobacillus sp.]|uniref:CPBP family intramembrane glutamic endopeptidase n=1 Tax=Lactobacillus sp. TaxID=1591 RepID=UPI0019B02A27|nr:CPBP family intramembrane glutamic endopeptidase [Lactobacillus sp.]MBD5429008.1 CPBP family intramembrane metalloprotease [Lactobacillus sp.]